MPRCVTAASRTSSPPGCTQFLTEFLEPHRATSGERIAQDFLGCRHRRLTGHPHAAAHPPRDHLPLRREPVEHSVQILRLTPRAEPCQRTLHWAIHGARAPASQQVDAYGNLVHLLTLDEPHDEIRIVVERRWSRRDTPTACCRGDGAAVAAGLSCRATPLTRPTRRSRLRRMRCGASAATARPRGARCCDSPDARARRDRTTCPAATDVTDSAAQALRARQRRLPGPRARVHRLLPRARHPGALRQRLLPDRRARTTSPATPGSTPGWRRRAAGSASTSRNRAGRASSTAGSPSAATTSTRARCAACAAAAAAKR